MPSPRDRVTDVCVDPGLGREAFTYALQSGEGGSCQIDSVLEYRGGPLSHGEHPALYVLTVEARRRFAGSGLWARDLARRLGTSIARLYRLLDPTSYSKAVK